jgi:hypothetical protein
MDDERPSEAPDEDEEARKRRIRYDVEKMSEAVFSRETRDHLVRASTELLLAFDSMIPRDKIPEAVKQHYLAAKRETMLLVKSLLDAQIELVGDLEEKTPPPETGLRQITLD